MTSDSAFHGYMSIERTLRYITYQAKGVAPYCMSIHGSTTAPEANNRVNGDEFRIPRSNDFALSITDPNSS